VRAQASVCFAVLNPGRAQALDAQVASDAGKISQDYADLVSLSVRQASTSHIRLVIALIEKATVGGIEVTISKDSSGNYNTTDTLVFLKGTVCRLFHSFFVDDSLQRSLATATSTLLTFVLRFVSTHAILIANLQVIFPAWPAYMYLNPTLGKHLLEPLFQYQGRLRL
jgi:hypothetical protein